MRDVWRSEFTPLSIVEVSGQSAEPKGSPHGRSRELIGKRIRYTYGDGVHWKVADRRGELGAV